MKITEAKEIVYEFFNQHPKDDLIAMAMEQYGDDELIQLATEVSSE